MTVPSPSQITGLVLAGGRGSRMGGADKGLQRLRGRPLVQHALQRLQPQVGALMISANRHLEGMPLTPRLGSRPMRRASDALSETMVAPVSTIKRTEVPLIVPVV